MTSVVSLLAHNRLLPNVPNFVIENTVYETIMGSQAYGVSGDNSDLDIYGFCIPDKHVLFPHLTGEIVGFGKYKRPFGQYQQHHIKANKSEYDVTIYSIAKYMWLALGNNPNIIESLYTPENCVIHINPIGKIVRDNRHIFLHKGLWDTYRNYAYSQLHKLKTKDPIGKRAALVDKYGYDIKFAYNVVRLLGYAEQLLTTGTLNLQRDRETLKAIRRGDWSLQQVFDYYENAQGRLDQAYQNTVLPDTPNVESVKNILVICLEEHYGRLDFIPRNQDVNNLIGEIEQVLRRYR